MMLVCSFVTALFFYGIWVARQANEILATALHFTNTRNREEDFSAIQKQYGHRLRTLDGCGGEYCFYEIVIDNRLLSALHLVLFTELKQRFDVKGGRVQLMMLEYRTALKETESPVVHVQTDFCDDEVCGWMHLHPWSTDSQLRYNGLVEVGYTATVQRRREAYGLNVRCLYSIGGCRDIAGLLPSVWTRNVGGNVACLIPSYQGTTEWCKEVQMAESNDSCQ